MTESIRRINKLHISSQSENSLHGDLATLQDAFRIASLPGVPPQGLLLIKRLDLGGFPTQSSAPSLARLIDHRIRGAVASAIHADHGDFDEQPLVWFSDAAAAALGLAENVAANRDPRAWYWHTLFPDWRRGMDLADTLDAIAAGPQASAPATVVLGQVIACLIETLPAARLVDAIKPRLAQSLLRQAGVFHGPSRIAAVKSATPASTASSSPLPPAWRQPIGLALARWGNSDPRCLWLGYCALTVKNPALALDSKLLDKIESALGGFTQALDSKPAHALDPAGTAPVEAASMTTEAPTAGEPARPAARAPGRSRHGEEAPPAASPVTTERNRLDGPPVTSAVSGQLMESATQAGMPAVRKPNTGDGEESRSASIPAPPDSDHPPLQTRAAPANANREPLTFGSLVDSEYAGLVLVIRLLELLAIDRLLEQYSAFAELNLPAIIVRDIARRLRIAADHPLLQALPQPSSVEIPLDVFESPASWRQLIAAPGNRHARLHRFDTTVSGAHCYLTDRSRRLLLYAGPGDLPRWSRRHRITRHDGVHSRPAARALSPGVQLLISRYLRRYGDISLRQLVRRPGRLAGTRSHLDVLFDVEQTDIRIRKSGLDIDPGWVIWLARVVQFHYQDGESIDV